MEREPSARQKDSARSSGVRHPDRWVVHGPIRVTFTPWSTPRTLSCRRGAGSGIAGKISHGPAYHVHPHLLDVGPSPDLLTMPKAIVENTPFAVLAGPDDREVLVLTMDTLPGQIDLVSIETQQYAHVGAREVLDLVDFVVEREVLGQACHAGEVRILYDQRRLEFSPGVSIEVAAEHLTVLRPGRERDGGAMDADETFAVIADE